jgi:hypothetical protein
MGAARPVVVAAIVIFTATVTASLLVTHAAAAHMLLLAAFPPARVPLFHGEVELVVGAHRWHLVVLGLSFPRRTQPPTSVL